MDAFSPQQPSIAVESTRHISYQELYPLEDSVKHYVYCYWELKSTQELEEDFNYRVVSDGCMDIVWEASANQDLYVAGISPNYVEFSIGKSFIYRGIRFLPSAFPTLFNISAELFTDQFLPIEMHLPELKQALMDPIQAITNMTQMRQSLDPFLNEWISTAKHPKADERLQEAVRLIIQSQGNIALSDIQVGVSQRQLRRLFLQYLGTSPKVFANIVRFQSILALKPSTGWLKRNKVYYDLGYFDQAHFIKAFKTHFGLTPKDALPKGQ